VPERHIASIGKDMTTETFKWIGNRSLIISIAWDQRDIEQFSQLIDDPMKLEPKKP
jgi:hypothetical protein